MDEEASPWGQHEPNWMTDLMAHTDMSYHETDHLKATYLQGKKHNKMSKEILSGENNTKHCAGCVLMLMKRKAA